MKHITLKALAVAVMTCSGAVVFAMEGKKDDGASQKSGGNAVYAFLKSGKFECSNGAASQGKGGVSAQRKGGTAQRTSHAGGRTHGRRGQVRCHRSGGCNKPVRKKYPLLQGQRTQSPKKSEKKAE